MKKLFLVILILAVVSGTCYAGGGRGGGGHGGVVQAGISRTILKVIPIKPMDCAHWHGDLASLLIRGEAHDR